MRKNAKRLASLDLLRGADIFFLTVVCILVDSFHRVWPLPDALMRQLGHPSWVGFTVLDMVMPLFIFMCGAALPLALPRRLEPDGTARWRYWRHVLGRVALLWILGMVAQGELMSFDLGRISFFNNTLQTIACGYLISAAVMRLKSHVARVAFAFALAIGYSVFLHACGDMSPAGNAAVVYEVKFLTLFYPDASWHPVSQISSWHYTWWTTVPMFGFMALAGAQATEIVKGALVPYRKVLALGGVGIALLALGGIFSTFEPVIKHIFTASFTFLAMGVSYLLYALFYWVFDILGVRRGTGLIALFGRHSLLAYMCIETTCRSVLWVAAAVVLGGTDRRIGHGLTRFFEGPAAGLCMNIAIVTILCIVLACWERWQNLNAERRRGDGDRS